MNCPLYSASKMKVFHSAQYFTKLSQLNFRMMAMNFKEIYMAPKPKGHAIKELHH